MRAAIGGSVWWFIGTLLILAGSVMGVREAWQSLAGVPRLLTIGGALFVYHAGFIELSRIVGRRSGQAGRILAGIAAGLLPVTFVALAWLFALSPGLGALVGGGAALAATLTLGRVTGLFGVRALAPAAALVPSLLAELPLASTTDPWTRALLPLVGVAAFAVAARPWSAERRPPVGALLGLAAYGALALGAFALLGGPEGVEVVFEPGTIPFAGLGFGVVAAAAVVAGSAARDPLRARWPLAAPAAELLAIALLAAAALAGFSSALAAEPGRDAVLDAIAWLTVAGAAAALAYAEHRRPAALHLAIPTAAAAGLLAVRLALPEQQAWWPAGAGVVGVGLLLASHRAPPLRLRMTLWALALGAVAATIAAGLDPAAPGAPRGPAAALLGLYALAAHTVARRDRPLQHLVGAAAATAAALALVPALPAPLLLDGVLGLPLTLAAIAALYGLAGLAFHRGKDNEFSPLDDASLVAALAALGLCLQGFEPGTGPAVGAAAVAGVLLLRAPRDRTRLLPLAAVAAGSVAVLAAWPPASAIEGASLLATLAAGAAALATLRTPCGGTPGRAFLGALPLPVAGQGRALLDGFALAAAGLAVLSLATVVGWLGAWTEPERAVALAATLTATGLAAAAFALPTFQVLHLRGRAFTLGLVGGLGVLAAIVNRIGRPRAPDAMALRLAIIGVALWLLARGLARVGPRLAARLGSPASGTRYAALADVSAVIVGAVMVVDGVIVGPWP
ncbi:MAG: hypothetical protein R3F43_23115, partial [bacterium]